MTPAEFADIMRPIAMHYGASVTSGLRSRKHYEKVGGHPESRHLLDLAKDYILDNSDDNEAFMAECHRHGLKAIPSNNGAIHVQVK